MSNHRQQTGLSERQYLNPQNDHCHRCLCMCVYKCSLSTTYFFRVLTSYDTHWYVRRVIHVHNVTCKLGGQWEGNSPTVLCVRVCCTEVSCSLVWDFTLIRAWQVCLELISAASALLWRTHRSVSSNEWIKYDSRYKLIPRHSRLPQAGQPFAAGSFKERGHGARRDLRRSGVKSKQRAGAHGSRGSGEGQSIRLTWPRGTLFSLNVRIT